MHLLIVASLLCGAEFKVSNKMPQQSFVVTSKITATKKTAATYRQPVGHTHTCDKCGTTWDHQANPTHVCQTCGRQQLVQDRSPRMVTVIQSATYPAPVQRIIQQQQNCPNGNCPYVR